MKKKNIVHLLNCECFFARAQGEPKNNNISLLQFRLPASRERRSERGGELLRCWWMVVVVVVVVVAVSGQ